MSTLDATNSRGISATGAYLPQGRLSRADVSGAHAWALSNLKAKSRGRRSVASWDQDCVTMAVEAFRNAFTKTTTLPDIESLAVASTSHPFTDRSSATIVASTLALPACTRTIDCGTNRRAATSALLRELLSGGRGASAIVASEKRLARAGSWAEILWGDGAAAVVIDDADPVASLIGWSSRSEDGIDFYTAAGHFPYQGEERWIKDQLVEGIALPAIKQALEMAGLSGEDIQWAVLPDPVPGSEKLLANRLQLNNATLITQQVMSDAGDLGTALPIYGLALCLEQAQPGDRILVSAFGNGCDALVFSVNGPPGRTGSSAARQLASGTSISYPAFITHRGLLDLDFGPRSERIEKSALSVHERSRRDLSGFIGGKLSEHGPVQFPKSAIPVIGEMTENGGYIDVRLADLEATVVSFVADHLTYTPEPPFCHGLVEFDNGARVPMEYVDVPGTGLSLGDKVRMRCRIKSIDRERGYRHYFWKAAPVSASTGAV